MKSINNGLRQIDDVMKRLIINIFMFSFTVASYSNSLNDQLWQAILDGNELLSVELLKQGADINALDKQGLALMHRYASSGNEFMINWLFEHGADINVRDLEGSTPIFYALLNGHYRRVYQIITLGADVDVENINGMTPMSFAEHFEAKLFIKLLKNNKKKSVSEPEAVLQLLKNDKKVETARFYFINQKSKRYSNPEMLCGIPVSLHLKGESGYSLKIILTTGINGETEKEIILPVTILPFDINDKIIQDTNNPEIFQNMNSHIALISYLKEMI